LGIIDDGRVLLSGTAWAVNFVYCTNSLFTGQNFVLAVKGVGRKNRGSFWLFWCDCLPAAMGCCRCLGTPFSSTLSEGVFPVWEGGLQIRGLDADVDLKVVGEFADHLAAEGFFGGEDFGDR